MQNRVLVMIEVCTFICYGLQVRLNSRVLEEVEFFMEW